MLLQCRYHALQEADSWVLLECVFPAMIYSVRTKLRSDSLEFLHKIWIMLRFTEILYLKLVLWVFEEHMAFFFFSIIKTLSYTGGSQCSIFHKSVPSTELHTTPRSRNGSCIPEPNGIHDQKVLRSTELERHTWKSYSGFTCSQTLVPMPQVCSVGHAFRVQTV